MKSVFNNRELAHKWAAQSQAEGRGSNFFFDGPSLFSYGRHFEVARIVGEVVLFNAKRYSTSTAKHQNYARNAVTHRQVFSVPSMTDHAENAKYYLAEIERDRAGVTRARAHAEWKRQSLNDLIDTADAYCAAFAPQIPKKLAVEVARWKLLRIDNKLFSPEEIAKVRASAEAAARAKEKESEERQRLAAERLEKARAQLDAWTAGKSDELPPTYYITEGMGTRLRIKDKRIETSRGAQITLRTAVDLWKKLTSGEDVTGLELDGYTVNKWDGVALVVGCHSIPREELARLGAVLGLSGQLSSGV